jgi:hypothetical protein
MDRTQAQHEARAKISWGDAPEDVTKFLMLQGFTPQEASYLVREMFDERAATIRRKGISKVVIGSILICVPIVAFFTFMIIGFLPLKIFAVTITVGLWGAWNVLRGILMTVAPKFEKGDVAEQ